MLKNFRNFGVLGSVAFVVAYVLAGNAVKGLLRKSEPDVRSKTYLTKVADQLNRTLPKMLDKETELDSGAGLDGVFVYNYRLVNSSVEEIDGEKFIALLRPNVTKAACTTPETRDEFLRKGVSLRYSYADKLRRHVAAFDVVPKDCGF